MKVQMYKVISVFTEDKSPCCDIYDVIDKYRGDLISTELIRLIQYELMNIYGENIPIKLVEDLVRGNYGDKR
jgi:hypothetical protein